MWSDKETEVDLLGFEVHSNLLCDIVTDTSLLPITIGIFGDWGSGKSSTMKMLQRSLDEHHNVACIYFNGWQFEGYDDAKAALLQSILMELNHHRRFAPELKRKAISLIRRVNWLRIANIGYRTIIAPALAGQLSAMMGSPPLVASAPSTSLEGIMDDVSGEADFSELLNSSPASQGMVSARQLRVEFAELIAETELASVVILIDDLDRCEPERLVETLEAIKLFLAVDRTAFVIGADERIIRYAIAKRYETSNVQRQQEGDQREIKDDRQVDLVTDYVEKLIQIPYHLPRLSQSEIETYMSLLVCQRYLGKNFDAVHEVFVAARRNDIACSFAYQEIKQVLADNELECSAELDRELTWCSRIAPALGDVLKGNPRQVKRLLNALTLRRKLAEAAQLSLSEQVLVKLMVLEYLQPNLFAQLYGWQAAQNGYPEEISLLEKRSEKGDDTSTIEEENPQWKLARIRTWLEMPPSLADYDLRDYYWITRDRVTRILSGVSLLPLQIRTLLVALTEAEEGLLSAETKEQIDQLSDEDKILLLQEFSQRLPRETDQTNFVKTWRALADIVPAAASHLVHSLEHTPAASLEPAVAYQLVQMALRHSETQEGTQRLLRKWKESPRTLIGTVADDALRTLLDRKPHGNIN
jgi:hypothetical protein